VPSEPNAWGTERPLMKIEIAETRRQKRSVGEDAACAFAAQT
jgi:hypothetical protein